MNKYLVVASLLLQIFFIGCSSSINRLQYIEVMKSYPEYTHETADRIPEFTYALATDTNLIKLRERFNLEEIAGKGDEISKIINLMKWVHNVVGHDGSSINPYPRNAFNLIKICHEENRGVNCRMLAIILNEVYLSMGYKSRFVTCMPEEKNFSDCHVINSVYSTFLNKWIYMDPTFQVYLKDEYGNLLSIQEVRERLINNKPLIVNSEINHNPSSAFHRFLYNTGLKRYTSEKYLDYMSKNLFRLECASHSEFNSETSDKDMDYIQLVPIGYKVENNPEVHNYKTYKISRYYISNPDIYWKKPQDIF